MALFFEVLLATLLAFLLIICLAALFQKSYEACRKAENEDAEKEKNMTSKAAADDGEREEERDECQKK